MSNITTIKQHLATWLRVDTWDTLHPLDMKRFHKALAACFKDLGPEIAFDDFYQAMVELLGEHHPTQQPVNREERVRPWALKAEAIASFLSDSR